jgi:hypothetical protein
LKQRNQHLPSENIGIVWRMRVAKLATIKVRNSNQIIKRLKVLLHSRGYCLRRFKHFTYGGVCFLGEHSRSLERPLGTRANSVENKKNITCEFLMQFQSEK